MVNEIGNVPTTIVVSIRKRIQIKPHDVRVCTSNVIGETISFLELCLVVSFTSSHLPSE